MNAIIRWLAATLFPLIKPLIFRAIGLAGDQTRALLAEIQTLKFHPYSAAGKQAAAELKLAQKLGWIPEAPLGAILDPAIPRNGTEMVEAWINAQLQGLPQLQQQFLRKAVKLAYYLSDLSYWLGFAAKQPAAVSEAPSTRGPLPPTPEL